MKIVIIVRTRNEESNIERFCAGYPWADAILLADGGSTDKTVEKALKFPNVVARTYDPIETLDNGIVHNPSSQQLNYLCAWAEEEKADWIIMDDADCFPNYLVREHGRELVESTGAHFILLTRLYLWGKDKHFPHLAKPTDKLNYEQSLWAWKGITHLRWMDNKTHGCPCLGGDPFDARVELCMKIFPPYCLLHNPWPTPEAVEKKMEFYRKSGMIPDMLYPLEFGGPLEDLPDWAHE